MEPPKQFKKILGYIVKTSTAKQLIFTKAKRMLEPMRRGDHICRVTKALYGLRQAGRSWYIRLDRELRGLGACPTKADPCVYFTQGEDFTLIIVYVDDLLVMSRNPQNISKMIDHLGKFFKTKDLWETKYCLGLEFKAQDDSVVLK